MLNGTILTERFGTSVDTGSRQPQNILLVTTAKKSFAIFGFSMNFPPVQQETFTPVSWTGKVVSLVYEVIGFWSRHQISIWLHHTCKAHRTIANCFEVSSESVGGPEEVKRLPPLLANIKTAGVRVSSTTESGCSTKLCDVIVVACTQQQTAEMTSTSTNGITANVASAFNNNLKKKILHIPSRT